MITALEGLGEGFWWNLIFCLSVLQQLQYFSRSCFCFQLDMREQLGITDFRGKDIGYLNVRTYACIIFFLFCFLRLCVRTCARACVRVCERAFARSLSPSSLLISVLFFFLSFLLVCYLAILAWLTCSFLLTSCRWKLYL